MERFFYGIDSETDCVAAYPLRRIKSVELGFDEEEGKFLLQFLVKLNNGTELVTRYPAQIDALLQTGINWKLLAPAVYNSKLAAKYENTCADLREFLNEYEEFLKTV